MMSNRDRNFMWDYFVDYCNENDLLVAATDFDAWCDNIVDEAIDAAMEPSCD